MIDFQNGTFVKLKQIDPGKIMGDISCGDFWGP